jgi:hypothetical protein
MKLSIFCSIALCSAFVLSSCRGESGKEGQADTLLVEQLSDSLKPIPIFYELLMPVDMSRVFEQTGAIYDKDVLNSIDKINNYSSSAKMAMNMGVYGVDLGYIKMFGDPQAALRYFGTIHKLAMQLGIPEEYFIGAVQRFDANINNRDSITLIASSIYDQTDNFLKKAERSEASSLILLGGWIEGMYIAGQIMSQNDSSKEIVNRIASQKYALNNLITLLSNHSQESTVSRYLILLKQLRSSFAKIDIYYEQGKVDLDTIKKTILTDDYQVTIDPKTLSEITTLIGSIRNEIVK